MTYSILFHHLGLSDYQEIWEKMKQFTLQRTEETEDEIWVLQHRSVFTQGTSCKQLPVEDLNDIPVVHSDRGGQITYHGPGQLVVYFLLNIKKRGIGPRSLVERVEQSVIDLLAIHQIPAHRKRGAPGVYVFGKKIAALGFRIKNDCCYHGLSINVDMDLSPFSKIDPCGFKGLEVTQMSHFCQHSTVDSVSMQLQDLLQSQFC